MNLNRNDNRFDILRVLAAWLVLLSHCYPLGGRPQSEPLASTLGIDTLGGVGVAIFFVLSGYLITISLERSNSMGEFVWRRVLRIYPALIAITFLSAFLLGPFMTTLTQPVYWRHGMTWEYLATASAWFVKYPLPGVFADNPAPHAVNGSLWSLPYEIRCYFVLALLSLMPGSLRLKVFLVASSLTVLLVVRPLVPPSSPFDKFLGLDYYHTKLGLLFVLGAVFACWRDRIRPFFWPSVFVLVAACLMDHGALRSVAYVLGLGTLTLWLALYGNWLPRIPQRVGDWSYGAYLYGFPVQQTLAYFKLHEATFLGYVLACTAVTFALAGLSWHLVEKQALRWK